MKPTTTPLLGYALLGLLNQKPSSGYELRKTFAETAMGNYSSSPGAIYPALARLEFSKLIVGKVEEAGGLRRRRVYRISAQGAARLKLWLAKPIQPKDVTRGAGELMLRFSFMEQALGPAKCVWFLTNFRTTLSPYIAVLEAFLANNGAGMPLSARLAVDSGIRGYRALYDWTDHALQAYRGLQSAKSSKPSKGGRP